jgi:hypothetical protein
MKKPTIKWDRFPIQINSHALAVIHIFSRHDCIEDMCFLDDCIKLDKKYYGLPEVAAKQFIDQLQGQWNASFMMALRDGIDEELRKGDEKYGTKFAKYSSKDKK